MEETHVFLVRIWMIHSLLNYANEAVEERSLSSKEEGYEGPNNSGEANEFN